MRTPRTSFSFTVTTEQAELIEKAAKCQGGTVASFIRDRALQSANHVWNNFCVTTKIPFDGSELDRICGYGLCDQVEVRGKTFHIVIFKQDPTTWRASCNHGDFWGEAPSKEFAVQCLFQTLDRLSEDELLAAYQDNQHEYKGE